MNNDIITVDPKYISTNDKKMILLKDDYAYRMIKESFDNERTVNYMSPFFKFHIQKDEISKITNGEYPLIDVSINDYGWIYIDKNKGLACVYAYLGIDKVKARVNVRGVRWLKLKEDLDKEYHKNGQRLHLYNPIMHPVLDELHPDFEGWDVRRDFNRAKVIDEFLPREQKVCDIGCHMGFISHYLARHGHTVTGVERNKAYNNKAQQLNFLYSLNVPFYNESMTEFLKRNLRFDCSIVLSVFHHYMKNDADRQFVKDSLRKLSENSGVIITDTTPDCARRKYVRSEFEELLKTSTGREIKTLYEDAKGRRIVALTK